MATTVTAVAPVAGAFDHLTEALARLPEQFRGKQNWESTLTVLINPIQHLENVMQDVLAGTNINGAIGAQLTMLGKIVGQLRQGVTDDDDFRRYVRARIAQKRSKGTGEDLIKVSVLVVGDDDATIAVTTEGIASVIVRVDDVAMTEAVAEILIDFLRDSVAAGVRVILEFSTVAPAATFAFAGATGDGFGAVTSVELETENTFTWTDDDLGANADVTVPAGIYTFTELETLIVSQLPVGRVFAIAAVGDDYFAEFTYPTSPFSVSWDPPGADTAIELRDILGWSADIEDVTGTDTASDPITPAQGGTFASARE